VGTSENASHTTDKKSHDTLYTIQDENKGMKTVKIMITEAAEKQLIERTAGKQGVFKIEYDTEDCCAVNGIAMLWFVSTPNEEDGAAETNGLPVFVEKAKEIFFDENMIIDFVPAKGCFQLKSPNQYFNPCMSFIDKTKTA